MNFPCLSYYARHSVSQELEDSQFGPRLVVLSQLRKQHGTSVTRVFLCLGDALSPSQRGVRLSAIQLNLLTWTPETCLEYFAPLPARKCSSRASFSGQLATQWLQLHQRRPTSLDR